MSEIFRIISLAASGFLFILSQNLERHSSVEDCGGFFCSNVPIDQNAERIIFEVNGDGTITATVGITYNIVLNNLQQITTIRFDRNMPASACSNLFPHPFDGGIGGGGVDVELGSVDPYDFGILSSADTNAVVQWLRENNYRVEDNMIPLIDVYVQEGMYFLAMKLCQGESVDKIQPVVMTYESEHSMIPIRLTAVAAVDNMAILVWIFGEDRYELLNYENYTNKTTLESIEWPNQVFNMSWLDPNFGNRFIGTRFLNQYSVIQNETDGKFFITQYADTMANLLENSFSSNEMVTEIADNHRYITFFRGQLSPDQMTLDPIFIPSESDEPVSNLITTRGLDLIDFMVVPVKAH